MKNITHSSQFDLAPEIPCGLQYSLHVLENGEQDLSCRGNNLELPWTWTSFVPMGFTFWIALMDPGFASSQNALQKCFSLFTVTLSSLQ
ncbi:hypothetical protein ElyMa_006571400 [Elysia marginata]|uniref:Uncharacterized protein n=1 Tax=Elysia marginata TaxID=1093978 RepID=A0AAV4IBS6_9GAST|nr:hypothetical protein ElyMa_006571400 [Elysia marginata]